MHLAGHSSSDLPKSQYLTVDLFFPIHSYSCRPPFGSSPMLPYHSILPLLAHAIGAVSLSIDPPSFNFAVQYNNLLNHTSAINQTYHPYDIECHYISDPYIPAPDIEVCKQAIPTACQQFSPHFPFVVLRNEWTWISFEGCTLAYYMPDDIPRSHFPSTDECEEQIYEAIIDRCTHARGRYNVGTMNVITPPTPGGEGLPFKSAYPRYLIAFEELDSQYDTV